MSLRNPRVMDAIDLISRFVREQWDSFTDNTELEDVLSHEGYSRDEISDAFKWIESSMLGEGPDAGQASPHGPQMAPPLRILNSEESFRIGPQAYGYLMKLHRRGILDSVLLEEVIDRLMALRADEIMVPQARRMAALSLLNDFVLGVRTDPERKIQ